jgi:hypothetical protein
MHLWRVAAGFIGKRASTSLEAQLLISALVPVPSGIRVVNRYGPWWSSEAYRESAPVDAAS